MLQRGISACRICLFRVDLLPVMLAKMCQLCLLFFARAISALLRGFCSLCAPLVLYSARGRGLWFGTAFTALCVWCLGAVLYIFVLVRYLYYSSSMYDNGNIQHTSHEAYMYFRSFF